MNAPHAALLFVYLLGALLTFIFSWIEQLETPRLALGKAAGWPILFVIALVRGFCEAVWEAVRK